MKSISFPEMFNGVNTNIVKDYDATLQNLKLLLYSKKGELFGDPYYGAEIEKHTYDQNDTVLKDIVIDDIYSAIKTFMPQIKVNRKDIKVSQTYKGELAVSISAINNVDFTTDLYNIVIFESEA